MDSEGEEKLPVRNGKHLKFNLVGIHLKNYDSMLMLSPTGIGLLAGIAIPSRNFIISSQKDNALSLLEQSTQRQTNFNILSVGYGYGKRDYDLPCYLKSYILEKH